MDADGQAEVAAAIAGACREHGFFYVTGHGVDESLQARLEALSRRFFAQDVVTKMQLRMELGGTAWRGYFPLGGELTSGRPDLKEGPLLRDGAASGSSAGRGGHTAPWCESLPGAHRRLS